MLIKDRFEEFKNKNFYSRISVEHILELHIGLDEKGRKSIELRYPFTPRKVTGTSSIEVAQYKKDTYNTIRFSLCDEEISGLFYKFCEDLVEQTKELKDESEGYQAIINRFFQWKKMFVSSKKNFFRPSGRDDLRRMHRRAGLARQQCDGQARPGRHHGYQRRVYLVHHSDAEDRPGPRGIRHHGCRIRPAGPLPPASKILAALHDPPL